MQFVDSPPGERPTLQLGLMAERFLQFQDVVIQEIEIGDGAGRTILEMQADFDAIDVLIQHDLIVNPLLAIPKLHQIERTAIVKCCQVWAE